MSSHVRNRGGGGIGKIPTGIFIERVPDKVTYNAGEALDITGLSVKVSYSDDTVKDITDECKFSPEPGTVLYETNTEFEVEWEWQNQIVYKAKQGITVHRTLESVSISAQPTKRKYKKGETFSLDGLIVKANYNSGATALVENYTTDPENGAALPTAGTVTVTVSYEENGVVKTASTTVTVIELKSIAVTTMPTKTTYDNGEALTLSGMVVTAVYTDDSSVPVTGYTTNPANGSALSTLGSVPVTVSYTDTGITKTTTFNITVNVKIVTFAGGTDAELKAMLDAHYAGIINIADYWAVGQERKVNLAAMSATGVSESHAAQQVTFRIRHVGGIKLADGKTCAVVVGQKNGLKETGYMNSSNTNSGSFDGSARGKWLESTYAAAVPASFAALFRNFNLVIGVGGGASSGVKTITRKFSLHTEGQIFGQTSGYGGSGYSFDDECKAQVYLDDFKVTANRIFKAGDTGSAGLAWEASPFSGNSYYFCCVNSDGSARYNLASTSFLLVPFGCM